MSELPVTQIKQAIRRKYGELAMLNQPCCSASPNNVTEEERLPQESVASSASCGSPLTHMEVQEGTVVLDLGSGGGIDVFRASKLVGPTGKVIGIDSTPEMIFKAREVAKKYDYSNVEFRLGEIEHLPVETGTVDLVISNCVLNLVPDKALAFREIYRVLKPSGRISISDMVATEKLPKDSTVKPEEWAACITGAVTFDEYKELLQKEGFRNIQSTDENFGAEEGCCSNSIPVKSVTWSATKSP